MEKGNPITDGFVLERKIVMEQKYRGKSNIDIVRSYLEGSRPWVTVGYTGVQYVKRAVGEHWTDNSGQEWEQKASGSQKVNRVANLIREAIGVQKCKCGQEIKYGGRADRIFFSKTGLCENCLIDYETKLRIVGVYPEYERYKVVSNEIGHLKEAKAKIEEIVEYFMHNDGDVTMLCNEEGFTERWKNTNKEQILEDASKDLKLCKKTITALTKIKNEAKKNYQAGAKKYKLEVYGG